MMSRICPKCGAELQDDELFCCECGTKYEEPAPPEPETGGFCAKCGTELRPGAAFCPRCGAPRQEAGAEQPPVRERPAKPVRKGDGGKTAIIVALIAAFTIIAVAIVLWLAGVFGGRDSEPVETEPGIVISGTDWDLSLIHI